MHSPRTGCGERRQIDQMRTDVHRCGDGERVAAAQTLDEPGNRREERRQDDTRGAAVDRNQAGNERDDTGDRSRCRQTRQRRREQVEAAGVLHQRDGHRYPAHHDDDGPGHPLDCLLVIRGAENGEDNRARECAHSDIDAEKQHADEQRGNDGDGDEIARSKSTSSGLCSMVTTALDLKSFSPPKRA